MKLSAVKLHLNSIIALAAISIFLSLAIMSSLTQRPQVDEALFASPAYNLAYNGHFGTTIIQREDSPLTRIEQRTYWVMPLFLLNVSASFKTLGFGVFTMRLVSVFWGLVLLAAWYFIALKLSGNRNIALLCLFLLACDYVVLDGASLGRMDMMSAALGSSALAGFLLLRERNLLLSILVSQSFVVLSGLTHPNGIMAFLGLIFLTAYFDFRRINWRHVLVALVPYLIGGSAFGLWILQDPQAFKDQFIDNAMMSGRMKAVGSPLSGIIREFTERYPHAFGLGMTSGGHSGPIYLKSLILVGYAVGILGVIFTKDLRRKFLPLLVLVLIYFLTMSFIDGQKQTPYLIHIVPFYVALLSIWVYWAWEKRFLPRPLLVAGIGIFLALQTGGMALRIKQNTYAKVYQPAIEFLQQNSAPEDKIMGGVELAFGLNFSDKLSGDPQFGFKTGERAKFFVYDSGVHLSWLESKQHYPHFYEYLPRLLNEDYKLAYENAGYKIYVKNAGRNDER